MKTWLILTLPLLFTLCSCSKYHSFTKYYAVKGEASQEIKDISPDLFTENPEIVDNGLDNGVYWLMVPQSRVRAMTVYEFPSPHLTHVKCYQNGKEVVAMPNTRYSSFLIGQSGDMLFFRIDCKLEAYIPLKVYDLNEFSGEETKQFLLTGLYFGLALAVILFNLSFFFLFKERTFLLYSFFGLSINLSLLYSDSIFNFFFGMGSFDHLEMILHPLTASMGSLFASQYLNLSENFKRGCQIGLGLNIIMLALVPFYFYSLDYHLFAVIESLVMGILSFYWLCGLINLQRAAYAPYFALAYIQILFFAVNYYISKIAGLSTLAVSENMLKIGGVFEMALLTYSVFFRMQLIKDDNTEMKRMIMEFTQEGGHKIKPEEVDDERDVDKEEQSEQEESLMDTLSNREIEIIRLIQAGKSNKEIAEEIYLSVNTVKYHIKKIFEKLEVSSRHEVRKKSTFD
ncbi:LuxR C-terminal-related transcriptional regulator [Marinilongibacter aquaticus]|uniref:LuxR C-terminal-related transcriptional regulator n=1 Tax=Marinilongibacter aquaticus TaxID=2975157 RepID=UPI0021BDD0CE|nr:LuxR C-terminal-related transcriptional regulator [Marinilongibacter aquaticus]UBM59019.1 LuxR C-terminal-related transcriptional regulator [Marinilongibacter aquaticus]